MDTETSEQLRKGEELTLMLKGEAWGMVRAALMAEIEKLNDLSEFEIGSKAPTTVVQDLRVNKKTAEKLLGWLKSIEDAAETHKFNLAAMQEMKRDEVVLIVK